MNRSLILAALLVAAVLASGQQGTPPAQTPAAPNSGQPASQPLDLEEAVSHDVLEPLQAAIQTQNLKQALSVFDAQAVPDFPQVRDQLRALFDSYSVLLFRYKILQASAGEKRASVTCEADVDATPLDRDQPPIRRSNQLRLELKQTPKGWQIVSFSPANFFSL